MIWVDAVINRVKESTNKLEITSLRWKVSYFFEEVKPGKLIVSLDQKTKIKERKKMERETKFPWGVMTVGGILKGSVK